MCVAGGGARGSVYIVLKASRGRIYLHVQLRPSLLLASAGPAGNSSLKVIGRVFLPVTHSPTGVCTLL